MDNIPVIYKEEQRFTQIWLWAFIIIPAALCWYVFYCQIILGVQVGNHPGPDWLIWLIWLLVGIGLPVLFGMIKLVTEVQPDQLRLRFRPFYTRSIRWDEIARAERCTYRPIAEYGGWGIRWNVGVVAYTMSGNEGVMLSLHGGKRVLVGSQLPGKLSAAIARTAGSSVSVIR